MGRGGRRAPAEGGGFKSVDLAVRRSVAPSPPPRPPVPRDPDI